MRDLVIGWRHEGWGVSKGLFQILTRQLGDYKSAIYWAWRSGVVVNLWFKWLEKCFGQAEASGEINFQCVLLCNFPPAVMGIPDVNTKVATLTHPGLSFWHASVMKDSKAKGI